MFLCAAFFDALEFGVWKWDNVRMRKLVLLSGAICIALFCGAAEPAPALSPFEVEKGALSPTAGHVQGFCSCEDAFYISQMRQLSKFNWNGKLIKKVPVLCHTGDICFWDGCVYAAVSVYQGPDKGKGVIQVYDSDLNLVREAKLDRGTDGITCLDGVLYVGMGANHQPSKEPHRENVFCRFEAKTLKPLGERQIVDFGHKTKYGSQDISHDGEHVLVSFYRGEKGAPAFVAFDRALKPVKLVGGFDASQGFDLVPKRKRGDRLVYARTATIFEKDPANPKKRTVAGCRLTFFEYKDGEVKVLK